MKPDIYEAINNFRKEMNDRFDKIEGNYVTKIQYDNEVTPLKQAYNKLAWALLVGFFFLIVNLIVQNPEVIKILANK